MSSRPTIRLPEVALSEIPARKELLYQLKCLLIATYAVSGFLLVFGLAAVLVTAPDYEYPISVGGGCFFAVTGFAHSVVGNLFLIEARKPLSPSGEESSCYRRITWSGTQWIVLWTNVIGFLLSMVFSAVFPMNTCIKRLADKNSNHGVCNPNPVTNLVLALFVFILSLLLMGLQVVFYIKKRSKVMNRGSPRRSDDADNNAVSGAFRRVKQTKRLVLQYIQTPASQTKR